MLFWFLSFIFCCFSEPRYPTNRKIVAIVATNDIHGHALPLSLTRSDTNEEYTQGGLPTLAALINIVKKQFPGNTLYFDSGDQFQGGVESSPTLAGGKIINAFMDYMKVDGAAVGNHDFDNGYDFLQEFLSTRNTVNLAANLQDEKGNNLILPKQQLSKLYTLRNGIKIGAIGLTTKFTPARSPGWSLGDQKISRIEFSSYAEIVKTQSGRLRSEGANAVILVSHVGDTCHIVRPSYGIWANTTDSSQCMKKGEIHQLLDGLPQGTIDAVLQGHFHEIMHNYIRGTNHTIAGVPVVGNRQGGKYFNILYMEFSGQKLVSTEIEGPIPVCQKVFSHTMECEYIHFEKDLKKAGRLMNWRFHDFVVHPDIKMELIMEQLLKEKIKPYLEIVCLNQKYLTTSFNEETEFNNLLGLAIASQAPEADLTLLTPSLLRQNFYPGPIRKLDLFNFHPFNSPFVVFTSAGKTFVDALYYLQTLQDGFNFSNELEQTLWISKDQAKKGLTSVRWLNGSEINPETVITGVMHNFTLTSIQGKYSITRVKTFGILRDIFEKYLRGKKVISKDWKLVDPLKPRMIVNVVGDEPK